jgi:cobalamin biosynthesis protein CobT
LNIKTKDIVDKTGRRIAVQVKAKDFDKMVELLEDYALVQLMEDDDKPLSFKKSP